jgi:hypothetical protein
LSVTATIIAFRWSIHKPTFVVINFSFRTLEEKLSGELATSKY